MISKVEHPNQHSSGLLPGDVAISFRSFLDIDPSSITSGLYKNPSLSSPFEVCMFLLNLANLIEGIVTQNCIYCFAWEQGPAFSEYPNLPVRMLPIHKSLPDYKKALAAQGAGLPTELDEIASEYDELISSHEGLLTVSGINAVPFQSRILLGDILRSQELGLNFYPSALESNPCIYKIVRENVSRPQVSRVAVDLMESARRPLAVKSNERIKAKIFDAYVPAVFGAVLRDSRDLDDLFRIAVQMRETREAKAFRKWAASVDLDENLARIDQELSQVQILADDLAKGIDQKPKEIQLQLGVSFIGSVQLSIPVSIRRKRKRHLTFLKSLFDMSSDVARLNDHVKRVLAIDRPEAFDLLQAFSQRR
jgi:hypothetical protein